MEEDPNVEIDKIIAHENGGMAIFDSCVNGTDSLSRMRFSRSLMILRTPPQVENLFLSIFWNKEVEIKIWIRGLRVQTG